MFLFSRVRDESVIKATNDDIQIEPEPEVKEKPLGFLQSPFTRQNKQMFLMYLVLIYSAKHNTLFIDTDNKFIK